ncbi:hypothetical protein AB0I49_32705 [Streptomyces sp. NPDC050617]|uniref:hypothetical protein n=1 Tax=Streptomyces sp. NPDC050617 TaxID=3154628 RepID=UPI0034464E16
MSTPSPGPTPSPGASPTPAPPGSAPSDPRPTPSPSPGPSPHLMPPWGSPPDLEVSHTWLEHRAADCDTATETLFHTLGPAGEAFGALTAAAPGWSFVHSVDDMKKRWEKLNGLVRGRLGEAADNFRLSAGEYARIDHDRARDFRQIKG